MININYEFRKGIFFIRIIYKKGYKINSQEFINIKKILKEQQFKYIVINLNTNIINTSISNNIIELFNYTHNFSNKI